MSNYYKALGLIVIILCVHSCISNRKVINQFIGANQNELRARWGSPDKIDQEGNFTVWIYDRFDGKFPGTTGSKSIATEEDGDSLYDQNPIVKFFINSRRTVVRYELIEREN